MSCIIKQPDDQELNRKNWNFNSLVTILQHQPSAAEISEGWLEQASFRRIDSDRDQPWWLELVKIASLTLDLASMDFDLSWWKLSLPDNGPQLKLTTSQLVDFSSSIRNLKWKQKKLSTMEAGMRALLLLVSLRVRRESSLHLSLRDLRVKEGSLHQSFWKHFDKV